MHHAVDRTVGVVADRVGRFLGTDHKLGRVLLNTLMKLDGGWTLNPDLSFIKINHLKNVQKKRILGPADLAVEVLSPLDEGVDRKIKYGVYARFGIPWFWVVDLDKRVLKEYELVEDTYKKKVEAPFDTSFHPRAFPGLVIDPSALEWRGILG